MAEFKMRDFDLVGQLGRDLLLVEVAPKPKYEKNEATGRNERTGEIDGYTYEVLMKDKKYKSIRVSVQSDNPVITQSELDKSGETFVSFEGISCNPYVSNGFIALSFKAESVQIKKKAV
ncbi:hypothetical protein [Enterococcus ratti]|uniref:Uncharacterized protein n=1 Tax=Enterococcus ratti TaxID=150033 RepID=A0A1L8WR55_9ENTE|nr:hypothetical protein [Enterococcus ratti]OJG83499.1 hypothetical protein RV14_GL001377 [Enterococcus ratti]